MDIGGVTKFHPLPGGEGRGEGKRKLNRAIKVEQFSAK